MLTVSGINFAQNTNLKKDLNTQSKSIWAHSKQANDTCSFKGYSYCGLTEETGTLVKHLAKYLSCFTNDVILEARTNNNRFMHLNLNPNKGALTLNVMKKNGLNDFSNSKNFKSYDLMLNAIKLDPADINNKLFGPSRKTINHKITEYLKPFADKFKN